MKPISTDKAGKWARGCAGVIIGLSWMPSAFAYPAHYFVINEAADGVLTVRFHQHVEISGAPASTPPEIPASRLESRLAVAVRDKASGRIVQNTVVVGSPWLRGEFLGNAGIDGRVFPLTDRTYVVRVPLAAGTVMRLSGNRGGERVAAASGVPASAAGTPESVLEVDLDQYSASPLPPPPPVSPRAVTGSLIQNGDPANRLDLLIVAEGYTTAQQNQFLQQATALANALTSISPYAEFRQLINFSSLFVASNQSGADKPACAETPGLPVVMVDTAFDATFCSGGLRRLVTVDAVKVLSAAAAVPDWDKVIVLVNDEEYGGSGGNVGVVTTNTGSAQIMQHEFGHQFTLLADEYEDPNPGYFPCSDLTADSPCEANVTDQTDRTKLKWAGWVAATTPVPTLAPLADPLGAGLWQGARYLSSGMYRQCFAGIMRIFGSQFCRVDSEAFVKRLYGGWGGAPAQGVSLIEPNAIPAGSAINAPPQTDVAFQATLAGSLAAGGLAYTWIVDGKTTKTGTSVHGAQQSFTYRVPDSGTHTVELRVSDSTPFTLTPPVRSRNWTVQGLAANPVVVEFYNTILDNFFITANAGEASAIDSGSAGPGWMRTGLSFNSGGDTPVCRFYGSISPGPNSHFYTVSADECQGLKNMQFSVTDPRRLTVKSWNFESLDFSSTPPSGGQCPNGTVPVYRAYDNGFARGIDSNHRITTSQAAIAQVVARGWASEGVVMCAPV